MAQPLTVAIIDSTGSRRAEMAKSFSGLAEVRFAYPGQGGEVAVWRTTAAGDELQSLGSVDLVLRHFGNRDVDGDIKPRLTTICYGGNGGDDGRIPDPPETIWRPVNAGEGCLSAQEANELIHYVRRRYLEGDRTVEQPTFLKKQKAVVMLSALSILCQGYLAVMAEKKGKGWGPDPIVIKTLRDTGFIAYAENGEPGAAALGTTLSTKRGVVQSPAWWSQIFNSDQTPLDRSEVQELIARECGAVNYAACPDAFKKLVDAIHDADTILPNVVSDAYNAISDKLNGK